jgi:hypothetical protein
VVCSPGLASASYCVSLDTTRPAGSQPPSSPSNKVPYRSSMAFKSPALHKHQRALPRALRQLERCSHNLVDNRLSASHHSIRRRYSNILVYSRSLEHRMDNWTREWRRRSSKSQDCQTRCWVGFGCCRTGSRLARWTRRNSSLRCTCSRA